MDSLKRAMADSSRYPGGKIPLPGQPIFSRHQHHVVPVAPAVLRYRDGSPPTYKAATQNVITRPAHQQPICLCAAMKPMLFLCRIFGMLPLSWDHDKDGLCVYSVSKGWIAYSLVVTFLYIAQLVFSTDWAHMSTNKLLPEILQALNDCMYTSFSAIITFVSIVRIKTIVKTYNKFAPIMKEGLLCSSGLVLLRNFQILFTIVLLGQLSLQYLALVLLHYSDNYESDFDYNVFINKLIQFAPFLFYGFFCATSQLFIGTITCFEKTLTNALQFTPVHPLKEYEETNHIKYMFGYIRYVICKEKHDLRSDIARLPKHEVIEYLRCLHEEICLTLNSANSGMNPQFLIHITVELGVLIVHWYAVIVYTSYDFATSNTDTINVLDWIFVVLHTIGLFIFLKTAQELINLLHSLNNFLLEYSTRMQTPEEHQQIRIFIEKIKQLTPLSASGVFDINLGIAGPICANILTYVLVALQFEVPDK